MSDAKSRSNPPPQPVEMEAVRTTIVGGRPPGSGKHLGDIPRGIEVLLKKAAVDPAFRRLLLGKRAGAAEEIGLALTPAEEMILRFVSGGQLAAAIDSTEVDPRVKPALLGKAAAVMLAALGASSVLAGGGQVTKGVRAEPPPPAATAKAPDTAGQPVVYPVAGVPAPRTAPASAPASGPTTTQASQATTLPRPEEIRPVRGVRVETAPAGVAGVRPDMERRVAGILPDVPDQPASAPATPSRLSN